MELSTVKPFDLLPDELIIHIFTIVRNGSASHLRECDEWLSFVIRLCSVCHRWRKLIIDAPLFWNFFVLSSNNSVLLAPLFFERSKSLPIDLIVSYFSSEAILPLLSSQISRIQSLEIRSISPNELFDCLPVLSAIPATSLDRLTIRCCPELDWDCIDPDEHFSLVKSTEYLRSVVLKGVCSRIPPPLVNLTLLEVHKFAPTFAEFRDLFSSNPALSTLCLPGFIPTEWLNEEYSSIDASSLRSFSVGLAMHWGPGMCSCMLTFLKMDNLEYFEISGNSTSISDHFSSTNGLSKVHTLRLQGLDAVHAPNFPLWDALRGVTRIELHDVSGFSTVLAAKIDTGGYFPKLASLLYDAFDFMKDGKVAEILCSRNGGLHDVEVPFDAEDVPQEVMTKLNAANIKLVFIDSDEAAKGLTYYGSKLEDEEETDLSWSDDDRYDSYYEYLSMEDEPDLDEWSH